MRVIIIFLTLYLTCSSKVKHSKLLQFVENVERAYNWCLTGKPVKLFTTTSLLDLRVTGRYLLPRPMIKLLYPRGFGVSVPDRTWIRRLRVMGNVNQTFEITYVMTPLVKSDDYWRRMVTINGTVKYPVNGEWTYENTNITLNSGDTLCYWVYIDTLLSDDKMKKMGMYCEFYVDRYPNGTLFYTELFHNTGKLVL